MLNNFTKHGCNTKLPYLSISFKMLSEPLLLPFFNFFVASVTSFAETGKSNSFIRSLDLSKSFIEQNQCPNVSLNNQREITLILKRDKRKSISAEENKKHFKELTKYKNTVIDTTLPKFINLFSSKANLLGRTTR